jgi:uncharacterized Zn finger protein
MSRRRYYNNYWYRPSVPKSVEGGIKAQTKRGSFVTKWWGKRWIECLESFSIGARLSRGRSYARKGQVKSLDIEKGSITAKVQGSRSKAYSVTIKIKTFSKKDWKKVIKELTGKPIYTARLLGNKMPLEIETIFEDIGQPLFPGKKNDLKTNCSCPDWSNPCKHIAAVYYLMAEAFDNDPFLLFKLRGMDREELMEKLNDLNLEDTEEEKEEIIAVELPMDEKEFWGTYQPSKYTSIPLPPTIHAAIPKRLGNLPFWRGEENFLDTMDKWYKETSSGCEGIPGE